MVHIYIYIYIYRFIIKENWFYHILKIYSDKNIMLINNNFTELQHSICKEIKMKSKIVNEELNSGLTRPQVGEDKDLVFTCILSTLHILFVLENLSRFLLLKKKVLGCDDTFKVRLKMQHCSCFLQIKKLS